MGWGVRHSGDRAPVEWRILQQLPHTAFVDPFELRRLRDEHLRHGILWSLLHDTPVDVEAHAASSSLPPYTVVVGVLRGHMQQRHHHHEQQQHLALPVHLRYQQPVAASREGGEQATREVHIPAPILQWRRIHPLQHPHHAWQVPVLVDAVPVV